MDTLGYLFTVELSWSIAAPPLPPMLHVSKTGSDGIHLHWKMDKEHDYPISGFLLHWRREGGDWQERELDKSMTSAQVEVSEMWCPLGDIFSHQK